MDSQDPLECNTWGGYKCVTLYRFPLFFSLPSAVSSSRLVDQQCSASKESHAAWSPSPSASIPPLAVFLPFSDEYQRQTLHHQAEFSSSNLR
ncbi:unnamed protein product [Cuscuta campestris]|uniref:Uncharacterized protein n=1 Tax=Cuscuta campestris TaxID=132261 RepID=A0A484K905_9ASTE|nr:unnamed protein product [Cuscuta campestris]